MKRVFLFVLDSLGIGEAPDAALFGDAGSNTLKRISASENFKIPTLLSLGLGNIDGVNYLERVREHPSAIARISELSMGKDTTIGHFELMGLVSNKPLPTYPDGFPIEIIESFKKLTGRGVLCNKPYSGTEVIKDYGDEHIKSGDLIVYTSADSVFQIAAHEDIVPIEKLYEYCLQAREILVADHAVGRVIARPFVGSDGKYRRTANRRDFSLTPPRRTLLNAICDGGLETIGVGKIRDIFAGSGIKKSILTHSNKEGMLIASELLSEKFSGLCFVNLVDFDSSYGHRQDIDGYAKALSDFDEWLPSFIDNLNDDDHLIITADHGCDPGDDSTDHTREYIPFIYYKKGMKRENLGTIRGFTHVANTVAEILRIDFVGESK